MKYFTSFILLAAVLLTPGAFAENASQRGYFEKFYHPGKFQRYILAKGTTEAKAPRRALIWIPLILGPLQGIQTQVFQLARSPTSYLVAPWTTGFFFQKE
jgi:hypothetical protein